MHFIGIDIGTSSICGVVYNISDKKIESITRNNNTSIESQAIWEKAQDPEAILELVLEIVNEFIARHPLIKGIGITGQMHGILYVDENGNAVSPLYTWQDGRGNQLFKDSQTYAGYLAEKTGYSVATGYGLVTHFFNKENNLIPDNAVKLCTIMDYIAMKLSGKKSPLIDYSNGASLGFFNIQELRFDTQVLERLGIHLSILPEANESACLIGFYNQTIPVYSAIGDNQASFIGSVQNVHSSVHITVGTSSQLSVYSEKYVRIETLDTRPFPGGGYILVGAALCGGQSFAMLKTFFEDTLHFFGIEAIPDIYAKMVSVAYDDTALKDLPVVETLFDGTRAEPWKRGAFSNISTSNFTPEKLILGFLKGITKELYDFYKLIPEEIKQNKTILVGSGNGIKKNPLLVKALEEQFNYQLTLSEQKEEAALGACLCGMVGAGLK